ncbi:hypothetical protein QBC43DRAFT_297179 [Cladorrhinum sp. PSN259]|nr:hypothetical protein QBC43DRAFT_297179 [Cladorrhinum sp. PSN259]
MTSSDSTVGVAPPPPGVIPNFEHPSASLVNRLILAAAIAPAVTLPFLLLRLYTSNFIVRRWNKDDTLIILGYICALSYAIITGIQTHNGAGTHLYEVTAHKFRAFMKVGAIGGSITYNLSTLFIKLSILTLYLRYSPPSRKYFRIAVYVVMFIAAGYCFTNAISFLFTCTPIERLWDPAGTPGRCIDSYEHFMAGAGLNVGTDIIILLLPVWMLWGVRLGTWQKVGLAGILMCGGFVCSVSIVRLRSILKGDPTMDFTWSYVPNVIWCLVEMFTGVICACLAAMRPFFKHYFPNWIIFRDDFEMQLTSRRHFAGPSKADDGEVSGPDQDRVSKASVTVAERADAV